MGSQLAPQAPGGLGLFIHLHLLLLWHNTLRTEVRGISCLITHSFFLAADRVFGPATTTRHVYDVAAQHVVSGAMEGINGNLNSLKDF